MQCACVIQIGSNIMGMKFRKSKSSGPFRVTVSKSGLHTSVGGKGFRVGVGTNGKVRTTVSIPGTGISYTSTKGGSKSRSSSTSSRSYSNSNSYNSPAKYQESTRVTSVGFVIKLLFVLFLPFLLWFWLYLSCDNMTLSIIVTAIIEVVTVALFFGRPQIHKKVLNSKNQSVSCGKNEWICPECETINSNALTICKNCGRYK